MSNTRNIQPITAWTPDGQKVIELLSLTNFCGYDFLNGGGKVTYILSSKIPETTTTTENGDIQINPSSWVTEIKNELPVPSNVVQQWGADDDIIFVYVAQQLGLTII